MAETTENSNEIKDTDIVFDCPHCGKSLAIDYRGAGLFIPCTDCGKTVTVPIPEGMELADIDLSEEEQEIKILHLRKSLIVAEHRIVQLELELKKVTSEIKSSKEQTTTNAELRDVVAKQSGMIEQALNEIKKSTESQPLALISES
ncbi:MAG: hypothetical protein KAH23_06650 [Kiritimatiellae bacterium]|nr:hypothetical protein [Kiritimatiellia bacterium]